jgi:hypothetical protein
MVENLYGVFISLLFFEVSALKESFLGNVYSGLETATRFFLLFTRYIAIWPSFSFIDDSIFFMPKQFIIVIFYNALLSTFLGPSCDT